MMRKFRVVLVNSLFLAAVFLSLPLDMTEAVTVYFNDFQTAVGPGWSTTGLDPLAIDHTPLPADGSRKFLGREDGQPDPTLGLHNETVSLSLTGLPAHTSVTVSFDLYVIQSWDGADPDGILDPNIDEWLLNVTGGPTLLDTTFSNTEESGHSQNYPDPVGGPTHPAGTGASEIDSLGYFFLGDSVYTLSFTFPHTATSLVFNFGAHGLQHILDESWGLDNVLVTVSGTPTAIPEPASLLLLGPGLAGLTLWRIRRKQSLKLPLNL
jgi:hypothetical protein